MVDDSNIGKFFFGFQRRLNDIIRFNTRPKTINETVAAHSFFVALYVLILAELLEKRKVKINTSVAVRRALLHDIEECVSGDVMLKLKNDPEMKKAYDKIALFSAESALAELPEDIKSNLLQEWRTIEVSPDTTETWLVHVADSLSGVIYAKEQVNVGNKYFEIILDSYLNRLHNLVEKSELEDIYDAILAEINRGEETKLDYEK